jgi:hypothetical protein
MKNDTPRTDALLLKLDDAPYKIEAEKLTDFARELERDFAKMRATLETVANARTLDEAKWAANNALVATTPIQFPSA